jgi:hypothetical protein
MSQSEETRLLIPKTEEPVSHQWTGMPISKLMVYSNDPFWVRLRCFCFGFFWSTFVVLSATAVVLIVTAPRCRKMEWWQEGPMYGIFAHEFRNDGNSSADGIAGTVRLVIFLRGGAKGIK